MCWVNILVYRMWCVIVCNLETSRMRRPWPALGRSATKKNLVANNRNANMYTTTLTLEEKEQQQQEQQQIFKAQEWSFIIQLLLTPLHSCHLNMFIGLSFRNWKKVGLRPHFTFQPVDRYSRNIRTLRHDSKTAELGSCPASKRK